MAYRVCLVDTDRFLLNLFATKFRDAGHEVKVCGSGGELLAGLRRTGVEVPDAILIDHAARGTGGFETLETIRRQNLANGSKIIVFSNQDADADIERAKELEVDSYLVKATCTPSEVFDETIRTIETVAFA